MGETETLRTETLSGVDGPVAHLPRAPRVSVREAVETAREEGFSALQSMPVRDLLDILREASLRFEGVGPPGTDPGAYRRQVTRATGMPVGWVRVSAHWLAYGLRHAAETLRAQSPTGGLDVYDDPTYTRERNVGLAFAPRARVLGALMPGNDPGVYAWPILALAMKVPVVVRPSDRDPFTPIRLARALFAAGLPRSAFHVLPGERAIGETLLRAADHGMAFGGDRVADRFGDDPTVETYGPGNSVAVLARDPTGEELDSLARGVVRAGGRTCYNLTRIVATGACDADALAADLAARVAGATVGPVGSEETDVPVFPDADRARRVDDLAGTAGEDVTARHRDGPRLIETDDGPVVRPTVVRSAGLVDELPAPFAGVTRLPIGAIPEELGRSYLGVSIGDEDIERRLVRSPRVRKLYGGRYPAAVDLRETHEEFLAEFLYDRTTYDP